MKVVLVMAVLGGMLAGAPVGARAGESEVRRRVLVMLSAHHKLPGREVMEREVPEVRGVLLELARDVRVSPLYRSRALSALAAWPDVEVRALYEEVLRVDRSVARHRVLLLFATAFRDEVAVARYLEDPDVNVRLTAIAGLAAMRTDAARVVLVRASVGPQQPEVVRSAAVRALDRGSAGE